ncbi:AMP-binding protein [Parvularcula sp. ZS-1/3]|uniref:AMP-binding protein n=1 Tax=Parvularcula mediterranea TaxID=2732508 RepID=A0A7Y3RMS0_9PROT|nr:AMP-binding protein [Parvularcula mediterranea]NNU16137.1 AMP-binding protein [Parvularcula mediterranea]
MDGAQAVDQNKVNEDEPAPVEDKVKAKIEAADKREEEAAKKAREEAAKRSRRRIWARSRSTVFSKVVEAKNKFGASKIAFSEPEGREISYQDVVRGAFALGNAFSKFTKRGENVGVLLPTSAGGIITILGLHCDGRVAAMLNFTAGEKALFSALETADIKHIITSSKFIEIAQLEPLVDALSSKAQIHILEDIKEGLGGGDKARAAIGEKLPFLVRRGVKPDSPAVILFTSGTEGKPKGVVLTHANLVANVEQVMSHVQLEPEDVFFNPLPIFHSYGLTGGSLFPLIGGHKQVAYPSPLHVKIIPEMIKRHEATILFGTDTFVTRYLKQAKPGALSTLRYAVCGAEKVRDETRNLARRKFGFSVLEGYGATEAAPVVAVNQPGDIRPGTVGKVLPGIETRIEPVEGLSGGGRLYVRGPNIMAGYLDPETKEVIPPEGGWHDTGDVVTIDGGGYVAIRGRIKRFAKISGEMVSLAVVENCASVVWPDAVHAAVIMPDPKKGEQIILLTEEEDPNRSELLSWAQTHGVPELAVPKKVLHVEDIPVLGTGKVDYVTLQRKAEELIAEAEEHQKQAAE